MQLYCDRNSKGAIIGVYATLQRVGQEVTSDASLDVQTFLNSLIVPSDQALQARLAALEANVATVMALPTIKTAIASQPATVA